MRELKFRAWVYYGENLEKPHYSRDYRSLDRFFEDHSENDIDQCIEQYTGIKDKNGKEIYEGDIIKDKDFTGKNWVAIVSYDEQDAEFFCEAVGQPNVWGFSDIRGDELEVIDNIHENSEYLERYKNDN